MKKVTDEEINKKFWKIITIRDEKVKVFIVNGSYIRTYIFIDFLLGAHHYAIPQYDFIPEGEIYIEEMLPAWERDCILVHESTEYGLMKFDKWEYKKAHAEANVKEQEYRKKTYDTKIVNVD
jgi:hypothetical protein